VERVKAGLKNALLSGDRTSSPINGMLKAELGAEIFLHYGMVESGLGTAVECCHRRGMHYRESDFFIEIVTPDGVSHPCPLSSRPAVYVDPDDMENGQVYGPSPWGDITITTLSREASPLIRYRTGDSGRMVLDRCACGSALWRLEVRGRMDERIELPAGQSIEYNLFDWRLYALPWIKDYHVAVHTDEKGKVRELGVAALLGGPAPAKDPDAAKELRAALAPVEAKAGEHGIRTHIRLLRDRQKFLDLFNYSPKRSFPHLSEPLDPARYLS
jgi:phenylacetate-coenzyme A ligase PaaK-like adenylate-forming protein